MLPIDAQITFCSVRDLDQTAEFWEKIVGLTLVVDQGTCRIYRVAGESFLGFCQRQPGGQSADIILTLVSPDVDAWYERLVDAGVEVDHPPQTNATYGIYHFFARDPDGYRVEIQRFLSPDWSPS